MTTTIVISNKTKNVSNDSNSINYAKSVSRSTNDSYQQIPNQISNVTATTNSWNLEGKVFFKGSPCNPSSTFFKVPPCTGPYPNYEVNIYSDNSNNNSKKTLIATTKTDVNGNYRILLEPGQYVIYTKAGKFPANINSNIFMIEEGKITTLDLTIDTGIR
jgi:hypothetical protein